MSVFGYFWSKIKLMMQRYSKNPILAPIDNWWETLGVYNGAVAEYKDKTYLLYRAQGNDFISRFGLAISNDGYHFKRSSHLPFIEPDINDPYERLGIEDPRITKIEDTYYITYTVASVYPAEYADKLIPNKSLFKRMVPWRIRVGMSSTKDFVTSQKQGILFPNVDAKNTALFPRKVGGRYTLISRILPNMVLSHSDNLLIWEDLEFMAGPRPGLWDSQKIGVGAPPILTKDGWLVFYHGVDSKKVYHLGAMLLDLENPRIILARTKRPLLSPVESYEKKGLVSDVVFTCGAIEKSDHYLVYYGGADKVMCVAMIAKDNELIFKT